MAIEQAILRAQLSPADLTPTATAPVAQTASVVVHPKFTMSRRSDGIVDFAWEANAEMGLEDAITSMATMSAWSGGKRAPLLVNAQGARKLDRAARVEFARRNDLV